MKQTEHIGIRRARLKWVGAFYMIAALGVVALFFALADQLPKWEMMLKIVGGIAAALLVLTGASAIRPLSNKRAGLHLSAAGFEDISTSLSVGSVSWKNVISVEPDTKEKHLVVVVKNPKDVIKSASNRAIKQLLERNYELYKSPVLIEAKYLNIDFKQLVEMVNRYHQPTSKRPL